MPTPSTITPTTTAASAADLLTTTPGIGLPPPAVSPSSSARQSGDASVFGTPLPMPIGNTTGESHDYEEFGDDHDYEDPEAGALYEDPDKATSGGGRTSGDESATAEAAAPAGMRARPEFVMQEPETKPLPE